MRPAGGWANRLDNLWHGFELKNGFNADCWARAAGDEGELGTGVVFPAPSAELLLIWAEGRDGVIISVL